jgi:hypothetical protein
MAHLQMPSKVRRRGPVAVRHDMYRTGGRRPLPLREPPRLHGRCGGEGRQAGWRLVQLRGGKLPDQVRLEGDPVVLGLVPGHLQHGPLQEGRIRASPEDLGRAAEAGKGAQEARQPGRHPHQPLLGRAFDVLVGGVVPGRQGARGRRQDPGHRLRQDGAGHRVVQGALQGRDGAGSPVLGRRGQQPLHPLRQGLLDPQSGQPVQCRARQQAAHRRRHQSPQ